MELILQAIKALLNKVNIQLRELAKFAVPANWQAAEGEPGHVLNRTHWTEVTEDEILLETTVELDESGQSFLPEPVLSVVIGEEYTVTWNGTEYKCVAQGIDSDIPGIGNVGVISGGEDTGEPFAIACFSEEVAAEQGVAIIVLALDGSVSATVSISGKVEIVHLLSDKYLQKKDGLIFVNVTLEIRPSDNVVIVKDMDRTFEQMKRSLKSGYWLIAKVSLPEVATFGYLQFSSLDEETGKLRFEAISWEDERLKVQALNLYDQQIAASPYQGIYETAFTTEIILA